MSEFISLYNFDGITVLYYSKTNIYDLRYKINHYINNFVDIITNNIVYIITNSYIENIDIDLLMDLANKFKFSDNRVTILDFK